MGEIMNIKVGVSARHVHLSQEDFENLFGNTEFYSIKALSQSGEFSSNLTVDLITERSVIKNVRVVGPLRNHSQVEISLTDAYKLGINPPIRMSNNFDGALDIMLSSNDKNIICKNSCIIANRHIHCKTSELEKYGLFDGKVVKARVGGSRGGIIDNIIVKTKENYELELHLDTDEANAFILKNGDTVELLED